MTFCEKYPQNPEFMNNPENIHPCGKVPKHKYKNAYDTPNNFKANNFNPLHAGKFFMFFVVC